MFPIGVDVLESLSRLGGKYRFIVKVRLSNDEVGMQYFFHLDSLGWNWVRKVDGFGLVLRGVNGLNV